MSGRSTRGRAVPTVAESMARIARDVRGLYEEVRPLRASLMGSRPAPRARDMTDRPDHSRGETRGTLEPTSHIERALEETDGQTDEAALLKVMRAIAEDLEGALADVRAIKNLIEESMDDPDERARFRALFKRGPQ
jgi:hypothetical protein